MYSRLPDGLSDERGMTLVTVAIVLPVLVLFIGLVIDTGNWWVHKRHLQVQADAAALAGATKFKVPCDGAVDQAIEETAIQYSGGIDPDNPTVPPVFNFQRGTADSSDPTSTIKTGIQEPYFFNDEGGDPEKIVHDTDLDSQPSPCTAKFVDVKMTEQDAPGFFVRALIPEIDAQARVSLQGLAGLNGVLPVGVEEVNPNHVHVWFWDEANNGELLGDAALKSNDPAGGLFIWDNSVVPTGVPATSGTPVLVSDVRGRKIGVSVALSGRPKNETIPPGADFATTCARDLIVCYGSSSAGLTRIRSYVVPASAPGTGVGEIAILEQTAGCDATDDTERNNGYFATECDSVDVKAEIYEAAGDEKFRVHVVGGKRDADVNLTYSATDNRWSGSVAINPRDAGTYRLTVEQTSGTRNGVACTNRAPCVLSTNAHSIFAGGRQTSGSIKSLRIDEGLLGTNVNNVGCQESSPCAASFVVRLGLAGRLDLAEPGDAPISLRSFREVTGATGGSLTQQLDCDFQDYEDPNEPGARDVREEYAYGCRSNYAINGGTACPNNINELPDYPAPLECVPLQTGVAVPQPADGLNARILCIPPNSVDNCNASDHTPPRYDSPAACTNPNNWDQEVGQASIPEGDPRVVPVFLVPFGTFDPTASEVGNGSGSVPVSGFAFFYVTAWADNGGSANPCQDAGDAPAGKLAKGSIYGHFFKHISPNFGGGTGETCDFDSIGGCVAVMTK